MTKSSTDLHWNERALREQDTDKVNIADGFQRSLETAFILERLTPGGRILEIGCGNGYLTSILPERAEFVDAFDYADNMVDRARKSYGETNNRFFHDNILEPKNLAGPYDAVVCVRVLINLRNLEEQKQALRNMAVSLDEGGRLILVEGFSEGFEKINSLRTAANLPTLSPAPINQLLTAFLCLSRLFGDATSDALGVVLVLIFLGRCIFFCRTKTPHLPIGTVIRFYIEEIPPGARVTCQPQFSCLQIRELLQLVCMFINCC